MNLQAAKTNYEREMASKEETGEEGRRNMVRQLRELESQLEDERKARSTAQSAAKKIESELGELESQIDIQTKGKDDALRMYKKVQVMCLSEPICWGHYFLTTVVPLLRYHIFHENVVFAV